MTSFESSMFIDAARFHKHVETLTPSQTRFVDLLMKWCQQPTENMFVVVSGGPGSGKTHTVVKTLRWLRTNIVFMAPTARLANKIGGKTIHSVMNLAWQKGSVLKYVEDKLANVNDVAECLEISSMLKNELHCNESNVDIVVLDEVGMIPFWLLYQIVLKFFNRQHRHILFVCMGDSCQLKPVMSEFNVFQIPFDSYFKTERIEMKESKRFTPEYQLIVEDLRSLMNDPEDTKLFDYVKDTFPVVDSITNELLLKSNRVVAYKNLTVQSCNDFYIDVILKHEKLYVLYQCKNKKVFKDNPVRLRKNCTVVVTENRCGNVQNGSILNFLDYDAELDVAICSLQDSNNNEQNWYNKIIVTRSQRTGMIPLVPGFAVTVHKFQGETIDEDNVIFCFDQCRDLHLVYTALSRVRCQSQILAVVL